MESCNETLWQRIKVLEGFPEGSWDIKGATKPPWDTQSNLLDGNPTFINNNKCFISSLF
jgi:hypothetical protein